MRKSKNARKAKIEKNKLAEQENLRFSRQTIESRERAIVIREEQMKNLVGAELEAGMKKRVYVIDGKDYPAPECFEDEEFLQLVEGGAKVDSKLVDVDKPDLFNNMYVEDAGDLSDGIKHIGNDVVISGRPSYFG